MFSPHSKRIIHTTKMNKPTKPTKVPIARDFIKGKIEENAIARKNQRIKLLQMISISSVGAAVAAISYWFFFGAQPKPKKIKLEDVSANGIAQLDQVLMIALKKYQTYFFTLCPTSAKAEYKKKVTQAIIHIDEIMNIHLDVIDKSYQPSLTDSANAHDHFTKANNCLTYVQKYFKGKSYATIDQLKKTIMSNVNDHVVNIDSKNRIKRTNSEIKLTQGGFFEIVFIESNKTIVFCFLYFYLRFNFFRVSL